MDLDSSVTYQVSDALKDRHPYSRVEVKRELRSGAGSGFGVWGEEDGIRVLKDETAPAPKKEEALGHLIRRLVSPEGVVRLIGFGVAAALNAVATPQGVVSPKCDKLACQGFKLLAAVPAGVAVLGSSGCLEVMAGLLASQGADETARLACCSALLQIATTWAGRCVLLSHPLPEGCHPSSPPAHDDELSQRIVSLLVGTVECPHLQTRTRALQTLELLMSHPKGLRLALAEGVCRPVAAVLKSVLEDDDEWTFDEDQAALMTHATTLVWNVSLDDLGREKAAETPGLIPDTLGTLLAHAARYQPDRLLGAKAALSGALSALFVKAEAKKTGVASVAGTDLQSLLLLLLKQANELYAPVLEALDKEQPIPEYPADPQRLQKVEAIIANTNQALRLLTEHPVARKMLKERLTGETFFLRRQIFFNTQFEPDFLTKEEIERL